MSFKVWLLERGENTDDDGNAQYTAIVQTPTPAGVNGASIAWPQVIVAHKRNTTQLNVGVGPTDQTQAEKDAIVAGTKVEFTFVWTVKTNWNEVTRQTNLQDVARAEIDKQWRALATKYFYYGFVAEYDE